MTFVPHIGLELQYCIHNNVTAECQTHIMSCIPFILWHKNNNWLHLTTFGNTAIFLSLRRQLFQCCVTYWDSRLCISTTFFSFRISPYPWQSRKCNTLIVQPSGLTGGNYFEECISFCTCYEEKRVASRVISVTCQRQKTHTWPYVPCVFFSPVGTLCKALPLCVDVASALPLGCKEQRCSSMRPLCAWLIILRNCSCSAGDAS